MLRGLGAEEWNGGGADDEARDEEAQNEEAQNEEAQNEEAQNEEAQNEEAQNEEAQDEGAQDEEPQDEEAQDEEAQDEDEDEDEEPPYPASQENEDSISLPSNPYPEDDFLLPLTRQPARTTPPPPFPSPPNLIIHPNSSPGLSIPSPGLSVPSNPYPEDAPSSPTSFSQPPPPPPPPRPTQSPSPYYRAVTPPTPHSRFPIYPVDRTISPISPFNASRHLISAEGTASSLSYRIEQRHRQEENDGYSYREVEGGYAPNHPYHGMSAQETSEYWLGLEGYHTESERNLRRRGEDRGRRRTVSSPVQYDAERVFGSVGESYEGGGVDGDGERQDEVRRRYLDALTGEERRMAEGEEEEEFAMRTSSGETNAGRKNMMNRLLSTFACRPGTVTPLHTTIPIPNDTNTNTPTTPAVPITPKKYTLAYLSHKIHRTQKHEEEARLRERLMALRLAEPSAPQTHHIKDINNPTEIPVLIPKPKAKRRKDSTQPNPNPPSLVPNLESRTQSVIGPPVGLSQMIQRAPGSVRVVTPLPVPVAVSDVEVEGVEGVGESGQRGPRQEHSGSSLSDRLRKTQLEDLPLQQDAAQEIRDLMMALERDQNQNLPTTSPAQHVRIAPHNANTNAPAIQRADELPAGFSTSSPHIQPSLSPHENLERHFRTQRQVNERFIRPVRAITSQSSSRTLPRSYRVPEGHGGGRGVLRVRNVVVQGEGDEGINEVGVGVGVDGGANSLVENQQDGTEELAAGGEEQKGESLLRYNSDEEGGRHVTEAG
ncbi:hypothetical protein J4E89_009870 [Alternaria sp. Ai002NY15]|nr:hypothetical protein J4E89_009870 [Alternaria sp. Ai002NY15]